MEITKIIKQDTISVDPDNIELPGSMQHEQPVEGDVKAGDEKEGDNSENISSTISLSELSQMILLGYNAATCALYRRYVPWYDASLTKEEYDLLQPPLERVLSEYNIELSPMGALLVAVVGINISKIMQIQFQMKQMQQEQVQMQQEKREVQNV